MKKSVKWVAATAAVMLTLSATAGMTSSADEGTTVKAGFIFLHDENSTYDLNFINAAKEAGMGGLVFTGDINEVKKAIGF